MQSLRKEKRFKRLCGWRGIVLILLGISIALVVVAGSVTVLHKTSDTAFCVSCHSMEKPLAEYQGSIHFQNHAGIRAECADCHVPSDPIGYMVTKVSAVKDVWGEINGTLDTEEKYNAHKLTMAQSVWDGMKKNDSATCRSCHSFEAMDILAQSAEARKQHPVAIEANQTCVDCHRGVAHILPDMRASNASGASHLVALAAATRNDVTSLYTIKTQPFTLAVSGKASAGTLFPAIPLEVLKREQGQLEVRLTGWQQEEVASVIYAAPGRRIISAVIEEASARQTKILASQTDDLTGTQWKKVALDLWLPDHSLIEDRQQIWQYAADLMAKNCTGCHGMTPASHFTANQWIGVMKSMAPRTSLDQEQLRVMTQYVQLHASDMSANDQATSKGREDEK